MRIDKFLWSVRFYKTRSIATDEIKKHRVSIGGQVVKSSKEVTEGDVITIRKNQIDYKIKVIQIPKSRIGAKLVTLHIKDMTDSEQYALLESRRLAQDYYRQKGEGRPTKKDRREMDGFLDIDDDDDEETAELSDKDWDNFFNDEAEGDE
ncbi:RNA-binding S4 domain-containing protein [Elizabethkingia anophelis]|uniref:RNA-binding S4 domain-containing protein n=1 Tax=Elizabethkingia anophelis TaxID=1117645 RepID=UPI003892B58A